MTAKRHERLLYAHRGASRHAPENTLEAFRRGLDDGADALELDVHLTADGHVVVSHDPHGARTCGVPRAIAASTLDEVRRWDPGHGFVDAHGNRPFLGRGVHLPLLGEVIDAFPGVRLNVDVKPRPLDAVRATVALVTRAGAADRVLLTSFHDEVVAEAERLGYAGPLGLTPAMVRWLVFAPNWVRSLRRLRGSALQVPVRAGPLSLDTPRVLERAHALGIRVDYWVVNDPVEAKRLLDLGADGIVTDDPAAIAPVFR